MCGRALGSGEIFVTVYEFLEKTIWLYDSKTTIRAHACKITKEIHIPNDVEVYMTNLN